MFHQVLHPQVLRAHVLRAIVASLVLLPVCAQAGPIIEYQSVEGGWSATASVLNPSPIDRNSDSAGRPVEPNPIGGSVSSRPGSIRSTARVGFDLDQTNNTFSVNGSLSATGNGQTDSGVRAVLSIELFVDFTVESDLDDLVELVFSVDGSIPGLEDLAADAVLITDASLLGPTGEFVFGLPANNTEFSRTESFLVRPGDSYRLVTRVDIENRDPISGLHLDTAGNFQLTSSLAVQSVPEPLSLAMLGFGLLIIGWRRRSLDTQSIS